MEQLESRSMLAVDGVLLSPSYLQQSGLVDSAFLERARNADHDQNDLVTAHDILLVIEDRELARATLSVIEDWIGDVAKGLAQRMASLEMRTGSDTIASGDPPGGGEGGGEGELPPPGSGSGGGGNGTWYMDAPIGFGNPGGGTPVLIGNDYYTFDLDASIVSVVNKKHTPTGVLNESKEDSEGAWLLVNNDNDDFNQVTASGTPVAGEIGADEDQTSPVVNEDDLLPIVLRANSSFPNYWYQLVYPNTMQIYLDPQKTTPVTWFFPADEDTELFVEAKSLMLANEITFDFITMNLVDEFQSHVVAYDVDEIRVNRFIISGPTSVPIGSRYIYNAIGVVPEPASWDGPTRGIKTMVQWDDAASFNDWQEVLWSGPGASMEKVVYELPNGYLWGLDVARVSITLQTSVLKYEGRVEQLPAPEELLAGTIAEYVSGVPGTQMPMMAVAQILVEGPKKNNRIRGSGEIDVGFVQNYSLIRQYAEYGETSGGDTISWRKSTPMNVPILDASPGEVWYDHNNKTGDYLHFGDSDKPDGENFRGFETYTVPPVLGPLLPVAAQTYWIDMGDGPAALFAPHWTDENFTENPVESNSGKWHFTLYIAARTTQTVITSSLHTPSQFLNVKSIDDPASAISPDSTLLAPALNSSNLYFQQANTYWDFVFDGSVTSFAWTKAGSSGLSGLSMFNTFQGDGVLVPSTTGPIANTPEGWFRRVSP